MEFQNLDMVTPQATAHDVKRMIRHRLLGTWPLLQPYSKKWNCNHQKMRTICDRLWVYLESGRV